MNKLSLHTRAVLQALLVTFLWSTSWVLIRLGLKEIPALPFAGLRYSLAFVCLFPFVLKPNHITAIQRLPRKDWGQLILLGIVFFAVTQGAQFLGLAYLETVTVSVLLNFTSPIVALLGIMFLAERTTLLQWLGIILFILGVLAYFYPVQIPFQQGIGILIVLIGVFANAFSSILGRQINRTGHLDPLIVTVISMGIGAVLLLIVGIGAQGLPPLRTANWLIIIWMAIVNTAFAFTLWNRTLQVLSAVESTIINGTMLIQIALLAWIFLGEGLNVREVFGLGLLGVGTVIVQIRKKTTPEIGIPEVAATLD